MTLDFTSGSSRNRPIRAALGKFLTSKLRGLLEISEGQRPAEVFYPFKYRPVWMIDTELQDGIVIPKGTIVSVLSMLDSSDEFFPPPSGATQIYSSMGQDGAGILENIDTSWYGYDQSVVGLLTPANGGVAVAGTTTMEAYSADDVTMGSDTAAGALATAGGTGIGRRANCPVGLVPYDIYQHIDGKYVNYKQFDKSGILCELPFIVAASGSLHDSTHSGDGTTAYQVIAKKYGFMWANAAGEVRPGSLITSDKYGKFRPQYPSAAPGFTPGAKVFGGSGGDSRWFGGPVPGGGTVGSGYLTVAGEKTVQTVGRIVAVDYRWPKDQLQYVDTFPGSSMPGTETGGLPSHLWFLLVDYLTSVNGTAPSIQTVLNFVQQLNAGVVRVQLEIGG